MAKVILRNGWYAPDNKLYKKSESRKGPPVEIPDELCVRSVGGKKDKEGKFPYKYLPTTAKVVDEDYEMLDKTERGHREVLDSLDIDRSAALAEAAIRLEAEEPKEPDRWSHVTDIEPEEPEEPEESEKPRIDGRTKQARFQKKLDAEKAEEGKTYVQDPA